MGVPFVIDDQHHGVCCSLTLPAPRTALPKILPILERDGLVMQPVPERGTPEYERFRALMVGAMRRPRIELRVTVDRVNFGSARSIFRAARRRVRRRKRQARYRRGREQIRPRHRGRR
ncbi:MAG: hypothetical protein WAT39_01885 [Planctomycetota bacterium]